MFRLVAAALIVSFTAGPAYAAGNDSTNDYGGPLSLAAADSAAVLAADRDWSLALARVSPGMNRPAALPALYASLAALSIYDGYTTSRGLSRGAQEANPIMRGVVGSPAAFWTMKAATSIGPMLVAERLWRRNRAAAIAVMVLANSLAAVVAANNAHVLGQLR